MAMPHGVLAAGWIPFVIVCVLTLLFSFLYVRYFQSRDDSEVFSSLACVAGLVIALLTCALVPVDIFLVSFMKTNEGHFKEWATDPESRQSILNGILYTYYTLYSFVILFIFLIFPWAYFFYEETEEDQPAFTASRCCTAFKYSLVVMLMAVVLLLVGAFVPVRTIPNQNATDTEWSKVKNFFSDLKSSRGENMLSFAISSLTLCGMLTLVTYTAYGLFAWPLDFVKGRRSVQTERLEVSSSQEETRERIDAISNKYRTRRRMTRRDERRVERLEDEQDLLERRGRRLDTAARSYMRMCVRAFRPFQIVIGVILLIFATIIVFSLLMTNIDKLMHSMGPKMGYTLPHRQLPNPIDITLLFAQKVFPLDYILMAALILYFFFCSMGGIQHIGIWFCWVKMYKIRVGRTKPQGLLFVTFLLMFTVLAINVLFYEIAPQYSTYGSQHYWMNETTKHGVTTPVLVSCSMEAPPDDCVMTRLTMLLTRFFYKMWFFGVVYYWASWLFLLVSVVSFVVCVVKKRRSSVEGSVDRDDITDSDDELIEP